MGNESYVVTVVVLLANTWTIAECPEQLTRFIHTETVIAPRACAPMLADAKAHAVLGAGSCGTVRTIESINVNKVS